MYKAIVTFCIMLTFVTSDKVVVAEEDVLNTCLDGTFHKTTPGPEADLFDKCSPWKERSCCTNETAYLSHQDGPNALYNFNYDHCGKMSEECKEHFLENDCFYECSPNIGPWIVKESNSYRNERFRDVPICESTCNTWFSACRNDKTCKSDWSNGWDWATGVNMCPENAQCKSFSEMFNDSQSLCEKVYPGDFKMISEESDKPCMVLWFEGSNPNDEVAEHYAKEMGLCCGSYRAYLSSAMLLAVFAVTIFFNH